MEITDKRKSECYRHFKEINVGDVFTSENRSAIFMKMENIHSSDILDDPYLVVNAVNLKNGKAAKYSQDDVIVHLNCECIITNK